MKLKASCLIILSMLFALESAVAEMRIWTDEKGKTIEAEFVRTTGDKVVLKQQDGKEIQVSLDTLSEKDRRFAILQAPPRIDISVSTDVDRSNKSGPSNYGPGLQMQKETIDVEVKISKSSSNPYEAPLMAELYLIGQFEKTDYYIVLERSKSRFSFAEENEHMFDSRDVSLKQLEAGEQLGIEYRGYLTIVRDKTGNILEIKTNKLDFQKNADAILGSERGSVFDENFNPADRKETMKEEAPARRRRIPGRNF